MKEKRKMKKMKMKKMKMKMKKMKTKKSAVFGGEKCFSLPLVG